ncbi:transmembrane protein 43 homolog [Procambarus clarkii]|uniref:transmembrane protein 43 homolog n=1 Tax=Procambarus clarkii TaxID=6728 RepID=UPI001E6789F7|nr:transmembrane protein 43 homolog [Procambarus clarkii]
MHRARYPDAPGSRGSGGHTTHFVRRPVREQMLESIPAVVVGITLLLVGSGLLFWNEGRAVQTSRSLDEGYNAVIRVASANIIHEENNHKLVQVWGTLATSPVLTDDTYGVEISAVRMKRRVQMYQWIEEESSMGSEETPGMPTDTSFSYSFAWRDKVVDSSSFNIPWGHNNPTSIPVPTIIQVSETSKVGAYHLSPAIKERFTEFISFSGDEQPEGDDIKLHGGMYYITRDIYNPDIGDLRIQFYFAGRAGEVVSIVGQQVGETLHPYLTSNGRELLIVHMGKRTVEEMFSSEHAQNRFLTWSLRVGGWFLMFIGLTCVTNIVNSLVVCSPLMRDVVALGLGSANLTLSMSTSLIIVGGAWAVYRPGLALLILIVAALPFLRAAARHSSSEGFSRRANGFRGSP